MHLFVFHQPAGVINSLLFLSTSVFILPLIYISYCFRQISVNWCVFSVKHFCVFVEPLFLSKCVKFTENEKSIEKK